jgi:hypothetical protein
MTIEEVKIGDFSKDLAPTSPVKTRLDAADQQLENKVSDAEQQLKPRLSYEEQLKELGVSKEEAAEIIDSILMKGYWAEDIQITKRVTLRLRTRQARDLQRAQTVIETQRPVFEDHKQAIFNRYCLAGSLERFAKDHLPFPAKTASGDVIESAFQERLTYVDNLSGPIINLVYQKLFKFDSKIFTILSEGVIENF